MTSSLSCTRTTVVNEVNLYAFYLVLHRHSEDCVFPLLCSFLTISSDYHHYTVIVLICSLCYHESVVRIVKISSLQKKMQPFILYRNNKKIYINNEIDIPCVYINILFCINEIMCHLFVYYLLEFFCFVYKCKIILL